MRQYKYVSRFGWLPRPSVLMLISFTLIAIAASAGGAIASIAAIGKDPRDAEPSVLGWLWILVPIAVIFVGAYAVFPCYFRTFPSRSVASRLRLQFSPTGDSKWTPPPHIGKVSQKRIYNQMVGTFEGETVAVFDAAVDWLKQRKHRQSTKKRSYYFQVVELDTPLNSPRTIIGGYLASRFDTEPIAGTEYHLHGKTEQHRKQSAAYFSNELIQFLASNPGLVIQCDKNRMSVYCNCWSSTRRQIPGNLPAFLEDVLHLRSLLISANKKTG